MMIMLTIALLALMVCGVSASRHSENERMAMDSYRSSEYRVMPYRA